MPARDLLTLRQLLDEYGWLSERFVRRLVAERRIPYTKVRGKLLFDPADVDQLAEAGRIEPVDRLCRPWGVVA